MTQMCYVTTQETGNFIATFSAIIWQFLAPTSNRFSRKQHDGAPGILYKIYSLKDYNIA